jgi:hypothetical protein
VTIIRKPRANRFTLVNNELIEDRRLSFKAMAVLVYILSKPDNWQAKATELSERFNCGRDAILSALKEIEGAGYLKRVKRQSDRGFFEWQHIVFDVPANEPSMVGLSVDGSSVDGSSVDGSSVDGSSVDGKADHITKTDLTKTELTITEEVITEEARSAHARKTDKFDAFVECYNQHKPVSFTSMTVVNPARRKKLENLIRDCGGVDNALVALANALRYAQVSEWCKGKDLTFENFASNDKILQYHERWVERSMIGAPPGASDREVQRAREIADLAKRLSKT